MLKKLSIVLAIVLFVSWFWFGRNIQLQDREFIKIKDIELNVQIADSNKERERGLSGQDGLEQNEGMLFIFEEPGLYGFWMKEMKFPIDIIWIGENMRVVYIKERVSPSTYPELFTPPEPVKYVLEVQAGFVNKNNIKIGDYMKQL